jgi:UDP-N-acetylmuramoyl-tripeptide--D-alanyl-D-alanine ligase
MIFFKEILKLKNSYPVNSGHLSSKQFNKICIDSRNIKPKDLFIAIRGDNKDGHNFLSDVFKKGVRLAVVEENWFRKNKDKFLNKPFVIIKDTIKALGEIAENHRLKFNIPVVCVGGSNGKTSTKDLISAVLSKKYNILKTEGNLNNHIGLPLTLLNLNKNHEMCVLEAGSNHFGEIRYLCEIARPSFGLITNIQKEHLEFFKDLKGVAKAEFELFDYLLSKPKENLIFANYDDTYIRNYLVKNRTGKSLTYSFNFKTDLTGKFIRFTETFEPVIKISYKNKNVETKISTFGKHSIFNGLSASAVGLFFGVSFQDIKSALSGFKQASSKRMEVIVRAKKTFINDTYNSNPDSVKIGLETLKEYKTKNAKHIVLGDMLELGKASEKEHFKIGELVKKMKFENIYTYGKESYNTFLGARGVDNNYYFNEKEDLSEFLTKILKPDDVVYLKGSRGMQMEDVLYNVLKTGKEK